MEFTGIIQAKISEVFGNESNPRNIDKVGLDKLVKSIKDFPSMLLKRPLVCITRIEGGYTVLGGNMRLKASKKAGLKLVPIILANEWTEQERNEFIVKDNVSFGSWDYDALDTLWNGEELEQWGLDGFSEVDEDEQQEAEGPESESAQNDVKPVDTNMIAISLSEDEFEQWRNVKQAMKVKNDKQAIFSLIHNYYEKDIV